MFFVGRIGKEAIATVGLTESVIIIVYAIGVGINMAATALIARRFGERKYKAAGTAAFQLLFFGAVISVVLGVLGFIFAGNTAIMLLFLINGAFRGAGQAHLAMRALILSNGLNIVLDPILIFRIRDFEGLGLAGAAWATSIGRNIGVLFQLYHLFNGKHRLVILKVTNGLYNHSIR